MSRARWFPWVGLMVMAVVVPACGGSASNHDNRIFSTAASKKLAATDLAVSYVLNPAAADDLYRGHVLEISGVVASVDQATHTVIMVGPDPVVWASLHDDVAAEMMKNVTQGQRITLKCICDGLDTQVHLKSCVAPDASR